METRISTPKSDAAVIVGKRREVLFFRRSKQKWKALLKEVGSGGHVTRMKFHNTNDGCSHYTRGRLVPHFRLRQRERGEQAAGVRRRSLLTGDAEKEAPPIVGLTVEKKAASFLRKERKPLVERGQ